MPIESLRVRANGIEFHCLASGPASGHLVLLLHGFPELAVSWEAELIALGAAGYRAVAPDLRGYGDTDLQGPYDVGTLSADVAGLIAALGREKAAVVGHDWGGACAWEAAARYPEAVERVAVLNSPYPAVLRREFLTNPRQLARSWYMLLFQIPGTERLLLRNRAGAIGRALRNGSVVKAAWTDERVRSYREAMLRPGRATAALGYYRAIRRGAVAGSPRPQRLAMPVLVLWGASDPFLGPELARPEKLTPYLAPGNAPRVELLDGVGHFPQVEAPERVSAALLGWLGA